MLGASWRDVSGSGCARDTLLCPRPMTLMRLAVLIRSDKRWLCQKPRQRSSSSWAAEGWNLLRSLRTTSRCRRRSGFRAKSATRWVPTPALDRALARVGRASSGRRATLRERVEKRRASGTQPQGPPRGVSISILCGGEDTQIPTLQPIAGGNFAQSRREGRARWKGNGGFGTSSTSPPVMTSKGSGREVDRDSFSAHLPGSSFSPLARYCGTKTARHLALQSAPSGCASARPASLRLAPVGHAGPAWSTPGRWGRAGGWPPCE